MSETGVRMRQIHRYSWRKPECRTDVLSVSSVTHGEIIYMVLIFILGVGFAVCILLVERVCYTKANTFYKN